MWQTHTELVFPWEQQPTGNNCAETGKILRTQEQQRGCYGLILPPHILPVPRGQEEEEFGMK